MPGKWIASRWFLTLDGSLALKTLQMAQWYSFTVASLTMYCARSSGLREPETRGSFQVDGSGRQLLREAQILTEYFIFVLVRDMLVQGG